MGFYSPIGVQSQPLKRLLNFCLYPIWWANQRFDLPAACEEMLSGQLSDYFRVDLVKALVYLLITPRTQSLFEVAGIVSPDSLKLAVEEARFYLKTSQFNQLARKIAEFGLLDWFTGVFEEVLKLNSDTKTRKVQIELALALLRVHKGSPKEVLRIIHLIPVHAGGIATSQVGSKDGEYPHLRSLLLIVENKYHAELQRLIDRVLVEGSENSGSISLEIAFGVLLCIGTGTRSKFELTGIIRLANERGLLGQFVCVLMFRPDQLLLFFDAIWSQPAPRLLAEYCEAVALEIEARFRDGVSAVTVYREFLDRHLEDI